MPSSIEYRILENGPGWYWEVIHGQEVMARGICLTQKTHVPKLRKQREKLAVIATRLADFSGD